MVTRHALAQFRERVAPGVSDRVARAVILRGLADFAGAAVPAHRGVGDYVRVRGPVNFRAVMIAGVVVTILRSGGPGRSRDGEQRQRRRRQRQRQRLTRAAART